MTTTEENKKGEEDFLEGNTFPDFHIYICDKPAIRCTHTLFPKESYMIGDEPDGLRLEVSEEIYKILWNTTVYRCVKEYELKKLKEKFSVKD